MRKFFLLLMMLSLSLAASANAKLSASTKVFMQRHAAGLTTSEPKKSLLATPKTENGNEFVDCFISLNGNSFAELEAQGVKVTGNYKDFVTASVPVSKLEKVAQLASVKVVAIARNARHHTDVAKGITNADKAWDGTNYGLPQGFKGKDVVLGIIDDGIQFNHRAFLNADGTSRVKAVYMPNATSANGGTRATIDGVQLSGYQYTTPTQIAALTCDDSSESHGTHTTGCAAGSQVGNYAGMAPEADLILAGCGSQLTETAILNSAKYIGNYAKNVLGKPCVISISLGSDTGPHDGKSTICLGYNQVAEQYGAVILLAAGNEADVTGHASKTLASDNDNMAFICDVSGGWWGSGTGACDIWNSTSDQLQVKVLIMNGNTISSQSDWMTSGSFDGVTVQGAVDPNNNRYQLYIESSASRAAFIVKGKAGNEIHAYADCYYATLASSGSITGYTFTPGTYENSMCDDMTAENVISVGAQASRSNDGYGQGDVAYFSSYGTDFNGVNHPIITAPGHYVISSVNGYDSYQSSTWSTTFNGQTYKWGEMSGTSMATPIAAGVVVLYLQADPTLDCQRVKEILAETATPYPAGSTSPVKARGYGIINALAGIEYILNNQGPTINVKPEELTFNGYAGETYTQTFNVKGYNLTGNVSIAMSGDNAFTISPTTLTPEQVATGAEVTVTYKPTAAGNTSATFTFTSDGAENKTATATGVAKPRVPTLIAEPQSLNFNAKLNKTMSKTIDLTGLFLTGDVTTTINDPSGVFTVTPATIAPSQFNGETPLQVTISFKSANEGNYSGSVTFASAGAESQTIQLTAKCSDNGTASDPFLDLAKYETIDEAGFTGVASLYKYTEYPDQETAWITMSNYGVAKNTSTQKWFQSSSLTDYNNTWTATDIFLGDDAYFGSAASYSVYGSGNQSFFVTNCKQFKALVKGSSYSSSNADLTIYECEMNADGSITATTTAVSTQQGSNGVITSAELNPDNIYKVQLTGGGSYPDLLEIGFQVELNHLQDPVATAATDITATSFVANWLPCDGATSYTLRVKPWMASPLLGEAFAGCTTNGSQNIGSSMDNYCDNTGWTGTTVYTAVGGVRLGTGSATGSIVTPALNLGTTLGKVYVKVKAKTYTNNSGTSDTDCGLTISCGDASETLTVTSATEEEFLVALDCTQAANQNVTLATTASRKRVIITGVEIYDGEPATGEAAAPMIFDGITANSYKVTGLQPATTYVYDVMAIYGTESSKWSNAISVLTAESTVLVGDVNADGEVTSYDITLLYNWLLENDDTDIVYGDQDGDGEITANDIATVYTVLLESKKK